MSRLLPMFMPQQSFSAEWPALVQRILDLRAFPGLAPSDVARLVDPAEWTCLRAGSYLFDQGAPSDAAYLILGGLLGAFAGSGEDSRLIGHIATGQLVGEMGLITGAPRSAAVKAIRNTEVLRFSRESFIQIAQRAPAAVFALASNVIAKLTAVQDGRAREARAHAFCVLPTPGAPARTFAETLQQTLGKSSCLLVTKEEFGTFEREDMLRLESVSRRLIYLADPAPTSWTRFCLSQSDCILLAAQGRQREECRAFLQDGRYLPPGVPIELVLFWCDRVAPGLTRAWLDGLKPRSHHHVRTEADARRASRLILGKAFALVLSGGGARGLAHIGVAHALHERNVSVDAVCGTSIGALIGACIASEWPPDILLQRAREFSRKKALFDFSLPRSSLLSPRKIEWALASWFEGTCIEDLPIWFRCLSTNLTKGLSCVHNRGELAKWVRASTAIPGVFPPVADNGSVLVDGGVLNNFPSQVARSLGANLVLGVDVGLTAMAATEDGLEPPATSQLPNIVELLMRVGTIGSEAGAAQAHALCDLVLKPNLKGIGLLSWREYERAAQAGYVEAVQNMDTLLTKLHPV